MTHRLRLKWIFVLTLILGPLLVGPVPGETGGGCGAASRVQDPEEFCIEQNAWICTRKQYRGEITDVEACKADILTLCDGAQWPFQCAPFPTEQEADACIGEVARVANLNVPIAEIPECRLCPSTGSGAMDAGASSDTASSDTGTPDSGASDATTDTMASDVGDGGSDTGETSTDAGDAG